MALLRGGGGGGDGVEGWDGGDVMVWRWGCSARGWKRGEEMGGSGRRVYPYL